MRSVVTRLLPKSSRGPFFVRVRWGSSRQQIIDGFVADFSAGAGWVLEVDGPVHDDPLQQDHDRRRTEHVTGLRLRVLRIRNDDVGPAAIRELLRAASRGER